MNKPRNPCAVSTQTRAVTVGVGTKLQYECSRLIPTRFTRIDSCAPSLLRPGSHSVGFIQAVFILVTRGRFFFFDVGVKI